MDSYIDGIDKSEIFSALNSLGKIDQSTIYDSKGKTTNFIGKIITSYSNSLGVLYFPWKRPLGVNKINHSYRYSESMGMNGTVIISNRFTNAAMEQVHRINEHTSHKILTIETREIQNILNR